MDVRNMVKDITKNKLHEIFIKTCTRPLMSYRANNTRAREIPGALVTPGKRKPSFQPDPDSPRPTKAACHSLERLLRLPMATSPLSKVPC